MSLFIPLYIITYRNVVDQSRYDSKGDALKTTNPAYALVGVSPGTNSPVTNKTADELYEMPSLLSHQNLPSTPLPVPTGQNVGVAREGEEGGVYDNIPDQ